MSLTCRHLILYHSAEHISIFVMCNYLWFSAKMNTDKEMRTPRTKLVHLINRMYGRKGKGKNIFHPHTNTHTHTISHSHKKMYTNKFSTYFFLKGIKLYFILLSVCWCLFSLSLCVFFNLLFIAALSISYFSFFSLPEHFYSPSFATIYQARKFGFTN